MLSVFFHLGLLPSVLILLYGSQQPMRHLLWLGILHMLILYAVGRKLPVPQDNLAVPTLHKAGFLHTLMGLGAAVMAVAQAWGKPAGMASSAGLVLVPLASALVPHILGVWFGHTIEIKRLKVAASLEDLHTKVAEKAQAALKVIDQTQEQMKRFNTALDEMITGCAETARRVQQALEQLNTTTKNTAHSAEKMQKAVAEVTEVSGQLLTVHQQVVKLLGSPLLNGSRKGEKYEPTRR
jgi:hypothetical protein